MRCYLLLRGTFQDYNFIGSHPQNKWWLKKYNRMTFAEYPSAIFEFKSDNSWISYINAVPSERKDYFGRIIRYNLLLESDNSNTEELKQIYSLLSCWINDVQEIKNDSSFQSKLGKLLDKKITKEYIDSQLARFDSDTENYSEDCHKEIRSIVSEVLDSLPCFKKVQEDNSNKAKWVSGLKNGKDEWISYIHDLINKNESGIAAYLNAATKEDAAEISKRFQNGAILIDTDDEIQEIKKIEDSSHNPKHSAFKGTLAACAIGFIILGVGTAAIMMKSEKNSKKITEQSSPSDTIHPSDDSTPQPEKKDTPSADKTRDASTTKAFTDQTNKEDEEKYPSEHKENINEADSDISPIKATLFWQIDAIKMINQSNPPNAKNSPNHIPAPPKHQIQSPYPAHRPSRPER